METYSEEKDKLWREQSEKLFAKVLSATNSRQARLAWYAACLSEENRLKWKYWMLKQKNLQAPNVL